MHFLDKLSSALLILGLAMVVGCSPDDPPQENQSTTPAAQTTNVDPADDPDSASSLTKPNESAVTDPQPNKYDSHPEIMKPVADDDNKSRQLTNKQANLKQVGLAFHNYLAAYGGFPGAASDYSGENQGLSWRVHLLPYLGGLTLYRQFHLDEPWDSEHNKSLISQMPDVYKTSEVAEEGKTSFQVVVGEKMAFNNNQGFKINSYTDGLSNIGFVVETGPKQSSIWTRPGGISLDDREPIKSLGTPYAYGFLILLGDGAVRTLGVDFLSAGNLPAIFTRNGSELIKWPVTNSKSKRDSLDKSSQSPESDEEYLRNAGKDNRKVQLKQIGLALHNYHSAHNAFPAASGDHSGKQKGLSWRVHLLPFAGEGALYYQFHLDEPWDSEHNKTLISQIPDVYATSDVYSTPGVIEQGRTTFQVVVGDNTAFEMESGLRMRDITDGLSNTAFVVETSPEKVVIWTKPGGLTLDKKEPVKSLGTPYSYGFMILMGDGATKTINGDLLRADIIKALFTRNGREVIPGF